MKDIETIFVDEARTAVPDLAAEYARKVPGESDANGCHCATVH